MSTFKVFLNIVMMYLLFIHVILIEYKLKHFTYEKLLLLCTTFNCLPLHFDQHDKRFVFK